MAYIPVPIEVEPSDIAEDAFAYLEEQVPGWLPSPGNLEAWLIEAIAQYAGELRDLAVLVPDAIFKYYGETVLGLPAYDAVAATGTTTWTMRDSAGYHVEAGTLVAVTPPASTDATAFAVATSFTVPNGQTTATGVIVTAIEPGAAASGLTGTVQVIDALDFVTSVVLVGATSGGQDAETDEAYLARLSDLLTLLSPRPILPQDFAILAQRGVAGVARATAIDLYNPGPPIDANCPRCVTVAVVDSDGNAVAAPVKTQVDTLLQSEREVNFLVFVVDPTKTAVNVAFTAMSFPGYDPVDVASRARAAVTAYLSPATWGVPPYGDTSARSWMNKTAVRYLELSQVINETDGIDYVVTLTINGGTADVTLPGVAPMPTAGTITGTCTAEA